MIRYGRAISLNQLQPAASWSLCDLIAYLAEALDAVDITLNRVTHDRTIFPGSSVRAQATGDLNVVITRMMESAKVSARMLAHAIGDQTMIDGLSARYPELKTTEPADEGRS